MNINAWGTDNFLKQHIRNKLEKVRVDDMVSSKPVRDWPKLTRR